MTTANTLAALVNSSSQVVVPSGGINFGTSSDGTGTVTSGVMDDFEEGTFTPRYDSNDGDKLCGDDVATGHYTKIDNIVYVSGLLSTNGGTTQDVWVMLAGIPFAPDTSKIGGICIMTAENFAGEAPLSGMITSTANGGFILQYRNTADGSTAFLQDGDLSTTASAAQNRIRFFGHYYTT